MVRIALGSRSSRAEAGLDATRGCAKAAGGDAEEAGMREGRGEEMVVTVSFV
jgi:hypothetical protein